MNNIPPSCETTVHQPVLRVKHLAARMAGLKTPIMPGEGMRAKIWTPPKHRGKDGCRERTEGEGPARRRPARSRRLRPLLRGLRAVHRHPRRPGQCSPFLAARLGQTEDETRCDGCRAERRSKYCQSCTLFACAARRGHSFCVECSDSPCDDLKAFQCERPHRADLFADLERIAAIGPWEWVEEASKRYACPDCGTMNSAYHAKCRSCGRDPSNAYVAEHAAQG